MASPAPKHLTLAEFLDWDAGTDRRYEVLDGMLLMMAPSLEAHGERAVALGAEIRARSKPPSRDQRGRHRDRRSRRHLSYRRPGGDAGTPEARTVVEPVLIVEVLSPSTGQVDRWRNVADYRTPKEILVIFSDERRVEVQRRTAGGPTS